MSVSSKRFLHNLAVHGHECVRIRMIRLRIFMHLLEIRRYKIAQNAHDMEKYYI